MTTKLNRPVPPPIDPAALEPLAVELAAYLRTAPPGGFALVQGRVRKAAKLHRRGFADLWADVHRRAVEILNGAA